MAEIQAFSRVDDWRSALGLLPIPLRDPPQDQQRFVLLNGGSGNFCLDLEGRL